MDLNANIAECIRSIQHIGSTEYVNICNGTHMIVPWGTAQWVGNILGCSFLVVVLCLLIAMAVGFCRMAFSRDF